MKERKVRLELFRQLAGKVIVQAPILKTPSQGFYGSKVKEYYR